MLSFKAHVIGRDFTLLLPTEARTHAPKRSDKCCLSPISADTFGLRLQSIRDLPLHSWHFYFTGLLGHVAVLAEVDHVDMIFNLTLCHNINKT